MVRHALTLTGAVVAVISSQLSSSAAAKHLNPASSNGDAHTSRQRGHNDQSQRQPSGDSRGPQRRSYRTVGDDPREGSGRSETLDGVPSLIRPAVEERAWNVLGVILDYKDGVDVLFHPIRDLPQAAQREVMLKEHMMQVLRRWLAYEVWYENHREIHGGVEEQNPELSFGWMGSDETRIQVNVREESIYLHHRGRCNMDDLRNELLRLLATRSADEATTVKCLVRIGLGLLRLERSDLARAVVPTLNDDERNRVHGTLLHKWISSVPYMQQLYCECRGCSEEEARARFAGQRELSRRFEQWRQEHNGELHYEELELSLLFQAEAWISDGKQLLEELLQMAPGVTHNSLWQQMLATLVAFDLLIPCNTGAARTSAAEGAASS